MTQQHTFQFATDRLVVDDWHASHAADNQVSSLNYIVRDIMTPAVTQSLPPPWQGDYTIARANEWIEERDQEGTTLLVQNVSSGDPVGLIILFSENLLDYRLGYMLHESYWGKGLASELIAGLVQCCRESSVQSLTGGVASENPASSRVLVKNGFELIPESVGADEQLFCIRFG